MKIKLFVDDFTLKDNITEFEDLEVTTNDVTAWEIIDGGYNISFNDLHEEHGGFSLSMDYDTMYKLYAILLRCVSRETKYENN